MEEQERWATGDIDDNGVSIHQFDIVEIQIAWETKTSFLSLVDMTANYGAMVGNHPAHSSMGMGSPRYLSEFIGREIDGVKESKCVVLGNHEDDELWNRLCEQNKQFDKAEKEVD